MRRLIGYMRPYRALVFFSLLFLLAEFVLQVLNPLLTRLAVDKYLRPNAPHRCLAAGRPVGRPHPRRIALPRGAGLRLHHRLRPDGPDAVDRPTGHVRSAQAAYGTPA